MNVLDMLSSESSIGDKGDKMGLFLTDAGYKRALENQDRSVMQILNHAKVAQRYCVIKMIIGMIY